MVQHAVRRLKRRDIVHDEPTELPSGNVLACAGCDQEMACDEQKILPLHMSRGSLCVGSYSVGAPSKSGQRIREPLIIANISELGVSEITSADTCLACGGPKAPGQTICRTCHGMLPFLIQKSLPPYLKGYLFADEQKLIGGDYTKKQFMDVFKAALEALATIRASKQQSEQSI